VFIYARITNSPLSLKGVIRPAFPSVKDCIVGADV
jgi:hypothetical protein